MFPRALSVSRSVVLVKEEGTKMMGLLSKRVKVQTISLNNFCNNLANMTTKRLNVYMSKYELSLPHSTELLNTPW